MFLFAQPETCTSSHSFSSLAESNRGRVVKKMVVPEGSDVHADQSPP